MAGLGQLHTQIFEHTSSHTFAFANQPEQNMFGADIRMIECTCFFGGVLQYLFGTLGKLIVGT